MRGVFLSHGSPMLVFEDCPARDFYRGFAESLGRPKAVLCVSAHWLTRLPAVSAAAQPETIHDFGGFPDALYQVQWPAPGAPWLADRVQALLTAAGIRNAIDPGRGLDHGVWVPLSLIRPEADVPVTQLSLCPYEDAAFHVRLGEALRPLLDEGVLIVGSGSATHNLRATQRGMTGVEAPPHAEAAAFADWLQDRVEAGDADAICAYDKAPYGLWNHPTPDHFLPLPVVMGALGGPLTVQHRSYTHAALAMDVYAA